MISSRLRAKTHSHRQFLFIHLLLLIIALEGTAQAPLVMDSREVFRSQKADRPISLLKIFDDSSELIYHRSGRTFRLNPKSGENPVEFLTGPHFDATSELFLTSGNRNLLYNGPRYFTVPLHGALEPCPLWEDPAAQSLAVSTDRRWLASVSTVRGLVLRNTASCAPGRVISPPGEFVDLSFVDDGLVYLRDGTVWLQRLESPDAPQVLSENAVRVFGKGRYVVLLKQDAPRGAYRLFSYPIDASHEEIPLTPEPLPPMLSRNNYPYYWTVGQNIAVAPDGVTTAIKLVNSDVLISTLDASVPPRLIMRNVGFNSAAEFKWSPDGESLAATAWVSGDSGYIFFVAGGGGGVPTGHGESEEIQFTDDGNWALFSHKKGDVTSSYNLREFRFGSAITGLPHIEYPLVIPGTHTVAYVLDNTLHVADLNGRWERQLNQPGLLISARLLPSDSPEALYFAGKFDGQDWGVHAYNWVTGAVVGLTPDAPLVTGTIELLDKPLSDGTLFFNADRGFGPRALHAIRRGVPGDVAMVHDQPASTGTPGVQWGLDHADLYFYANPNEYGNDENIYRTRFGERATPLFETVPDLYQFVVSPDETQALMAGSINNSYYDTWCDYDDKESKGFYPGGPYDPCTTWYVADFDNSLYHAWQNSAPAPLVGIEPSTGGTPRFDSISSDQDRASGRFLTMFNETMYGETLYLRGASVVNSSIRAPFGYSRDKRSAFFYDYPSPDRRLQINQLALDESTQAQTILDSNSVRRLLGYAPASGIALLEGLSRNTLVKVGLDPVSSPVVSTFDPELSLDLSFGASPDGRFSILQLSSGIKWLYSVPVADETSPRRIYEYDYSRTIADFRFTDDGAYATFLDATNCYGCQGFRALLSAPSDGSGPAIRLSGPEQNVSQYKVAPNSRSIAFVASSTEYPATLFITPIDGGALLPVEAEDTPSSFVWSGDRLFFISRGVAQTSLRETTVDHYPPRFTRQPETPGVLAEGDELIMTVDVAESTGTTLRWEFSRHMLLGIGNFLPIPDGESIHGANTRQLTLLSQARRSDAARVGYYRCVATNSVGEAYSRVAAVRLKGLDLSEGEQNGYHSADTDFDGHVGIQEVLRVIQLYNSGGFQCAQLTGETEDGFVPSMGNSRRCHPHDSDYSRQDWVISLSEMIRLVQLYNSNGYEYCPQLGSEDGFCTLPG
jgi:Tol biopolymer transport system component